MLVYLESKGIGLYLQRPDELDQITLQEQLYWIEKTWSPRTLMEFEQAYYKSIEWHHNLNHSQAFRSVERKA